MSHHVVKIKWSDKYVGSDLKDCLRDDAPIESLEQAEQRAVDRFGKNWKARAEIKDVAQAEWCRQIAKLPREMTRKKRMHLKRLHETRFPLRRYSWTTEDDVEHLIYARSAPKAVELLNKVDVKVNWRTFLRRAKAVERFPFRTEDKPGVWIRTGKAWKKIV
jgi:hypothetical protein